MSAEGLQGWVRAIRADRDGLLSRLETLVSVPSPNRPPRGEEGEVQALLADALWSLGMPSNVEQIPRDGDLERHPAYREDRDLAGRPNVHGTLRGRGGGRSLLLACHTDTLPALPGGEQPDGAGGGKGALACALHAIGALNAAGLCLGGDLGLTGVVDECLAGVQGMLGVVVDGISADAALYLGSPRLELAFDGPVPEPGSPGEEIVEPWACTDEALVAACREAASQSDQRVRELSCPPVCGAFLLNEYAGTPTAVLGGPTEAEATAPAPTPEADELERYAVLLAAVIATWCGLAEA
jgi:hypothetical protein